MDPITESFLCSICQHRTARDYHKNLMGGLAGAVCWFCFLAWYEQGKITDASIRQESIFLRHDDASPVDGTPVDATPHAEQPHFDLLAHDLTAALVVDFWLLLQCRISEMMRRDGTTAEACVDALRVTFLIPAYEPDWIIDTMNEASVTAREMERYPTRRLAD